MYVCILFSFYDIISRLCICMYVSDYVCMHVDLGVYVCMYFI